MKKITALILTALLAFSFSACSSQPDAKSTGKTTSAATQQAKDGSTANTATAAHSAASTASGSKSAAVNPNAKFTSKPAPKQQLNSATNDIKNTMSQIESTLNTLDTAPDVNTDNIQ